jgi:hypothetical protein
MRATNPQHRTWPRGIPGIFSFHDARRFWVLASFSLRAAAHVATHAPLRCSRKPRQNAKLGGQASLRVWAWATRSFVEQRPHIEELSWTNENRRSADGTFVERYHPLEHCRSGSWRALRVRRGGPAPPGTRVLPAQRGRRGARAAQGARAPGGPRVPQARRAASTGAKVHVAASEARRGSTPLGKLELGLARMRGVGVRVVRGPPAARGPRVAVARPR